MVMLGVLSLTMAGGGGVGGNIGGKRRADKIRRMVHLFAGSAAAGSVGCGLAHD